MFIRYINFINFFIIILPISYNSTKKGYNTNHQFI